MNLTLIDQKKKRKQQRKERDARRGRLGQGRFDALVNELAEVIRLAFEAGATASVWGLEGPLRHAICSDLCLQGWAWETADLMARELMDCAHRRVGAKRPTWNEGQPEWVIYEGTLIERTLCANCHKPLPEGRPKFCSDLCKGAHHAITARLKIANEDQAIRIATGLML
ncbi:hypothetical protein [Celeribacter indicus]|uniref:hypothetical protein n=1 Tax=Celeribacter indicus TaxID=1208324 RepID=UPI000944E367|nr:hypothetical protein [Celeribacter indicus]